MALTTETSPTIDGRGGTLIEFYIPDPTKVTEVQYGKLTVQIHRSDGLVVRQFDLLDRLTDDAAGNNTHLPALAALKAYILARIDTEILGL